MGDGRDPLHALGRKYVMKELISVSKGLILAKILHGTNPRNIASNFEGISLANISMINHGLDFPPRLYVRFLIQPLTCPRT
jgi:hypothetical protein